MQGTRPRDVFWKNSALAAKEFSGQTCSQMASLSTILFTDFSGMNGRDEQTDLVYLTQADLQDTFNAASVRYQFVFEPMEFPLATTVRQ